MKKQYLLINTPIKVLKHSFTRFAVNLKSRMREFKLTISTLSFVAVGFATYGQVSVTVTGNTNASPNLNPTYTSLASAVSALNSVTTFSGPVTLTCEAGNETAPAGGYEIQFSGTTTSINTVVINTSGVVNITASASNTLGSLTDALFKIIGCDYVSISGFNLQENPANTVSEAVSNNMTEWGIALLRSSQTNGAQYNTIQNNSITLDKTYSNSFGIYSSSQHAPTTPTSSQNPTSAAGSNSFNKVYGNSINNSNYGIVFVGAASLQSSTVRDNGNDIGGSSVSTGNTLTNCGGVVATSSFVDISQSSSVYCILLTGQNGFDLSYNTISGASFSVSTGNVSGILITSNVNATNPGSWTQNINQNTITLNFTGTATNVRGIVHQNLTQTGLTNVVVNITNNIVINCQSTTNFTGILNASSPNNVNINGNTVQGSTLTGSTSAFIGISNTADVQSSLNINNNVFHSTALSGTNSNYRAISNSGNVVNTLTINGNDIGTSSSNSVTFSTANSGSGGIGFIGVHITKAPATCSVNISGNDITGIDHQVTGSSGHRYIYFTNVCTPISMNLSGNTFSNLIANTTGTVTFFLEDFVTMPKNGTKVYLNNSIVGSFSKTPDVIPNQRIRIFDSSGDSDSTCSVSYIDNNFSNISNVGPNGAIDIIYNWDGSSTVGCPSRVIKGNTFSNLTAELGVNAIQCARWGGVNAPNLIDSNRFENFKGAGMRGIAFGTGVVPEKNPVTISNNVMNKFTSQNSPNVTPFILSGIYAINSSLSYNIFNNSITNFSSAHAAGDNVFISGITVNGTNLNVYANKIDNIINISSGTSRVRGICLEGAVTGNIYNNRIGNLSAPLNYYGNAISGIYVADEVSFGSLNFTSSSVVNLYYNSIYLNNLTSSSSGFGANGIFANSTPNITMINNLVRITGTPTGSGKIVAYRRSSGTSNTVPATYSTNSNNNMFYAGTPGAGKLIYAEGGSNATTYTNQKQTLADYQTFMTSRDQASTSIDPSFISTSGASNDYLKLNPCSNTGVENAGIPVAITNVDFEGNTRSSSNTEIGADEINAVISNTLASVTTAPTCNNPLGTVVVSSPLGTQIKYTVNGTDYQAGNSFSLPVGTYNISAKDTITGCVFPAATVSITFTPNKPIISASPTNPTSCNLSDGIILVSGNGTGTVGWFGSSSGSNTTSILNYTITGLLAGNYSVYFIDGSSGCSSDTIKASVDIVIEECNILVPTAITPDNDKVNDYWILENIDKIYPKNIVTIYNRWGNRIYQSNEGKYEENPWDGKYNGVDLPVSSYYFTIEYNDGFTENKIGLVSIIK
jgi:gliding motility-associated-like protein